jgi:hypothetical protein
MTDVSDGSGHMPRRSPRISDGGAPVSGGLAIALAVVAVVAGFLILRSISDSGNESADFPPPGGSSATADPSGDAATTENTDPGAAIATLPTTTTDPPLIVAGASVVVANANGQGGSASAMSRALEAVAGFTVVDPTNASATIPDLDESVIYFDPSVPAAQAVANSLARVLGGVSSIAPLPEPTPPTQDGTLNGAQVLLMLGKDKANQPLAELAPGVVAGGNGVVTVTNPDPTGTTSTTTG